MRRGPALLVTLPVGLLAAALSVWLAWHHPVAPVALLLATCAAAGAMAWKPAAWAAWLLPVLPLVGFMPWTGWLVVEELDVLLLAIAAGGYFRWALDAASPGRSPPVPGRRKGQELALASLCLLPAVLSVVVSLWRGVADAGGWTWGWWQGYHEPLNSLRLAKPLALTCLVLPLLVRELRRAGLETTSALIRGMALLLATVSLCVWWERLAYTGLLDFSSDYRATGLFWEMHVGGAALDAALCMSFPFAYVAFTRATGPWRQVGWLAVMAAGAYASLATFSRVVYVGVPVGVGLAWWLVRRQRPGATARAAGLGAGVAWFLGVGLLAAWLFPAGGYRALLALLACAALVLAGVESLRPLPARAWAQGLLLAAAAVAGVTAVSLFVPKGAYLAFAAAWVSAAVMIVRARRPSGQGHAGLVASVLASLAALTAVGVNWGGPSAWAPGLASSLLLALALMAACARRRPSWPTAVQWQGQLMALLVVMAAVVGVFDGGAYMGQRLTQTGSDGEGRQAHWRRALSWLDGADWLAGKGLGRFVTNFGLSGQTVDQVGDYRLKPGQGEHGAVLVLTGGKHQLGNGELFRVSQRIRTPAPGPLTLDLQIRAEQPTAVNVEITEKHLLYPMAFTGQIKDAPKPGSSWQAMHFDLPAAEISSGPPWAPRWIVFSMALESPGRLVEMDSLVLRDAQGHSLLVNGDFEQGLARWFSSSDRHHMPWHAKNVVVHLLFEQGLLGLLAVFLAAGVAFWRTVVGAAREHPAAPALAGALLGVAVVGMGDSLFDMPRIAFVIWWLVAACLVLPARRN